MGDKTREVLILSPQVSHDRDRCTFSGDVQSQIGLTLLYVQTVALHTVLSQYRSDVTAKTEFVCRAGCSSQSGSVETMISIVSPATTRCLEQ